MSGEAPKPVVTKAGKKPEVKDVEEKEKKGLFSRSSKSKTEPPKKATARKANASSSKKTKLSRADRKRAKAERGKESKASQAVPENTKPAIKNASRQSKSAPKRSAKRATRAKNSKLSKKSKLFMGTGVIAALAFIAYNITNPSVISKVSSDNTQGGLLGDNTSTATDPNFDILDSSAEDADKRYDPERGFYTFREYLNDKLITVNQQPIPANFELTADVLLAQTEYSSIGRLDTNNGSVYVARADTGPQHAVAFKLNNLLIFVTTTKEISDQEWKNYVNALN